MKLESKMWSKLRPHLAQAKLDPVRVENPIHPGTPDVNLVTGAWVELKAIKAWPRKANAKVLLTKYTPQQRVWLYRRQRRGGVTYLLLHVASTGEWLLFDGEYAARFVGRVPERQLRVHAVAVVSSPAEIVEPLVSERPEAFN